MSTASRPVPTRVTICDLCGEQIADSINATERGSLTHGYIAYPVTNTTKHAWLIWRKKSPGVKEEKRYDFHADCIGRLIEREAVR